MNKAQKKFRIYAILVIFVLLTVLLGVINGVNFTMASQDADRITQMISEKQGSLGPNEASMGAPFSMQDNGFRMGPMGPDSPEMNASLRYFTVAFSDKDGTAETVEYRIAAVTASEAQEWAAGLREENTGWSRGTYRYRVYKAGDKTYVTVIDQGRELLPSYRILLISAIGEVLCLIIGWFVLLWISKKVYSPLEEADRKQRLFIQNANKDIRLPLTIISGNTELLERKHGPDDQTRSTRRQIEKLNELVDRLGTIGIFEDDTLKPKEVPLSEFVTAALDKASDSFTARGLKLESQIVPDVQILAKPEPISRMIDEIVKNALDYALSFVRITLKNDNGIITLETKNDTTLQDGECNQVFDRFTTLDNSENKSDGSGLGLSYVKQIVKAYHGRCSAAVSEGVFVLRIIF